MFEDLNKNNSTRTVKEGIDTEGMKFINIREFLGKEVQVDGFFFSNSKFGKQVVVVGEGSLINVPKRYTADFEAIRDNSEKLAAVLAGGLKLGNIHEADTKNGKTVFFDFIG